MIARDENPIAPARPAPTIGLTAPDAATNVGTTEPAAASSSTSVQTLSAVLIPPVRPPVDSATVGSLDVSGVDLFLPVQFFFLVPVLFIFLIIGNSHVRTYVIRRAYMACAYEKRVGWTHSLQL